MGEQSKRRESGRGGGDIMQLRRRLGALTRAEASKYTTWWWWCKAGKSQEGRGWRRSASTNMHDGEELSETGTVVDLAVKASNMKK